MSSKGEGRKDFPTHRFAWEGISFVIPEQWNLAVYQYPKKNLSRLEFDDDYTTRLELEWTRPRHKIEIEKVEKRYDYQSRHLTKDAEKTINISNLPKGWHANLYILAEDQKLLTAFYLSPESEIFCFFLIHFEPEDTEDPRTVVRTLAKTFKQHTGAIVPWMLYAITMELPSEFRLIDTNFQTGMKRFAFRWKHRKFYIWFVNLADLVLKKQSADEWMARMFNSSRQFRGGRFRLDENGKLNYRRRRRHAFGHIDEIWRWCFEYRFECRHDKERNLLIPWVFNYRNEEDIEVLKKLVIHKTPLVGD